MVVVVVVVAATIGIKAAAAGRHLFCTLILREPHPTTTVVRGQPLELWRPRMNSLVHTRVSDAKLLTFLSTHLRVCPQNGSWGFLR